MKMSRFHKNANPEKNSKLNRPISRNDDSKLKVLEMLTSEVDATQMALTLEDIARTFHKCVLLYKNGRVTVYLLLPAKILDILTRTLLTIHHLSHSVEEVYTCYKTFIMCSNTVGDIVVIPRNTDANTIFKTLETYRGQMHPLSIAGVTLQDVYQLLETSQCSKCLKTYNYRDTCANCGTESRETDTIHDVCNQANIAIPKHISVNRAKKRVRSSFEKVILPTIPFNVVMPFYGQEAHFPKQVSEEQGRRDHYAYAISSDQPSMLPRQNYGFGTVDHTLAETAYPSQTSVYSNLPHQRHTPKPARYQDYVDFAQRMRSYSRWIHDRPDSTSLSEAGFFFTNQGDLVRCFQCGIGLKDFSEDDNPLIEHVRHSMGCPFLYESLGETRLSILKSEIQREDPNFNRRMQWEQRNKPTQQRLAYTTTYSRSEYKTKESRIKTFHNWPGQLMQTPEQLACAGFYYTGFEDHVRCFACDGGLKRWDSNDDPWTEHCRWFPACPFAREQKGEEYIAFIQASIAFENEPSESASAGRELSGAMEQMTLRDTECRQDLKEHKEACMEMGFEEDDIDKAVQELGNRGTVTPSIDDMVDMIAVVISKREQKEEAEARQNETPLEENIRLKTFLYCMTCGKNDVNALFLPCTHHRMCMACADSLTACPICDREIRQKIKTYLV